MISLDLQATLSVFTNERRKHLLTILRATFKIGWLGMLCGGLAGALWGTSHLPGWNAEMIFWWLLTCFLFACFGAGAGVFPGLVCGLASISWVALVGAHAPDRYEVLKRATLATPRLAIDGTLLGGLAGGVLGHGLVVDAQWAVGQPPFIAGYLYGVVLGFVVGTFVGVAMGTAKEMNRQKAVAQ